MCSEIFGFVLSEALCRTSRPKPHNPEMFTRITHALQAAADVVAPPCPRVEDLHYHWSQVSAICQQCKARDGQTPAVEETHVPRHLTQMLKVVVAEEREERSGQGCVSPCVEYLVREKVLTTLTSLASSDRPLGVRQHTYIFLIGILNHLHHSHLHHAPIHKPLQMMVRVSSEMRASPYESEEMEFLAILCEKIRQDNTIILLFIQPVALTTNDPTGYTPVVSQPPTPTRHTVETTTITTAATDTDTSTDGEKELSKFPLIEALLNLCHSADSKISNSAHECLLSLASVRNLHCGSAMSRYTLLPQYLASRILTAVDDIPNDTEPALIEDIPLSPSHSKADTELSDSDEDEDEIGDFPGKQQVAMFLHWLMFCDKVCGVSESSLASSIVSSVRGVFLEAAIRAGLTSADPDVVSLYIALTTKMVSSVSSPLLSQGVIGWLIEDSDDTDGMRKHLLHLCQTPPHHLQIQALRLLQVVVERPGCSGVSSMVLGYLNTRGYYDSSAAEHQQSSWSDEEDERHKQREGERSPDSIPVSRTLAPANINKIVKKFLSVVPEELRSTSKDDFESYMADAQKQYRDTCRWCTTFGWPREAVAPECSSDASSTASRDSKPESEAVTFYEGPFLAMLMNLLEHLPQQDYDINLQVTSIIASLALLPHPYLHEYLLNPSIPLSPTTKTPYTVLQEVVKDIYASVTSRDDYKDHLKVTRYHLLGTMDEFDLERDDDDRKFEALIVIEEFSKELASIAYAKYMTETSAGY